jgi:Fic family protein
MQQIKTQLIAEIKQFEADIEAQKRAIRHSTTKGLAVEGAEQNLKQLRTRLSVLETNLKKCDPEPEGEVA